MLVIVAVRELSGYQTRPASCVSFREVVDRIVEADSLNTRRDRRSFIELQIYHARLKPSLLRDRT